MFNWKIVTLFFAIIAVSACSSHSKNKKKVETNDDLNNAELTISGAVINHGPQFLAENVQLIIKLEDTSKQDVVSVTIAQQTIHLSDPSPWPFILTYDPKKLEKNGRYVLRASVEVEGKLRLINRSNTLAFNTPEPINIVVSAIHLQK
tara:strand:- start:2251 stop:2694 length:444 start_codon:yes stop_codon:yes gene_type:complete